METSQAWFGLNSKPSLPVSMPEKQAFLRALTEPIFDPKSTEICLDSLIASNPTPMPCSPSALAKFSQGKWQVCYAPHIRILEKVTLNTYDVYYEFIPTEDKMISYVRYDSPVFQKGWLNTSGRVESVSDNVCRVVWDKIWLDWNTLEQGQTFFLSLLLSRHLTQTLLFLTTASSPINQVPRRKHKRTTTYCPRWCKPLVRKAFWKVHLDSPYCIWIQICVYFNFKSPAPKCVQREYRRRRTANVAGGLD